MFRSILIIFNFKKLHDFPFYIQTKLYKTWIPALLLHDQMLFFPLSQVPLTALHSSHGKKFTLASFINKLNNNVRTLNRLPNIILELEHCTMVLKSFYAQSILNINIPMQTVPSPV